MCSNNDFPPYEEEWSCDCSYCDLDRGLADLEYDLMKVDQSDYLTDSIIGEYPVHGKVFAEEMVNLDSSDIFSARQKLDLIATKILDHRREYCSMCVTEPQGLWHPFI